MGTFSIQTEIKGAASQIAREILTMSSVNDEIMPIVRMTVPQNWLKRPIYEWPTGAKLFTSCLLLFGCIPFDLHQIGMAEVSLTGFNEASSSGLMRVWRHHRQIEPRGENTLASDTVEFEPRFRPLEVLLTPVYRSVFQHRHKKLTQRYGIS